MAVEIKVPTLGESVTEATVGKWFKKPGDAIKIDEPLCELETDKVTMEVPAPAAGVMGEIKVAAGATVAVGSVLGFIKDGAAATAAPAPVAAAPAPAAPKPAAAAPTPVPPLPPIAAATSMPPAPAARKMLEENGMDAASVEGSGRRGQVLKEDVVRAAAAAPAHAPASTPAVYVQPSAVSSAPPTALRVPSTGNDAGREERVKMSRLRQTIARRLKEAQNTAAMLTTYNEVDMSAIMALRNDYKEIFEKKHGVKLGFMSFFAKACIHALHEVPDVNAEIDGDEVVYKNYVHMGIAVGTPTGLVVPVVRDADQLSFAGIEKAINALGVKARDGKLSMADMQGGSFTISNGGVYGSLMSSPILNPPQSGILGMHKIQDRPVVVAGQIVIRPMMYLALSYDHRIVDGKGAVTFLVRVKEALEDPRRLLMDL